MNPVGATSTVIFSIMVVVMPRRWAALALMAGVCYITQGQQVIVMGFHFTAIRIILLAGVLRILIRGDLKQVKLNKIDWALVLFAASSSILSSIRVGTSEELNYQTGFAYNTLFSYFVFRGLVRNLDDFRAFLEGMALLIIPLALCMVDEAQTGMSLFNFMGGRDEIVDWDRGGRFRCVGSFRGPHTAGTFGATFFPLLSALFFATGRRPLAIVGVIASTTIAYTANASGPLSALVSGWIGLAFWPLRTDMRRVRKGIVVFLVVYALLSKAPVWFIFAKISNVMGGDGWTRSYVFQSCFNHFSDWWLMGTSNTDGWAMINTAWGGADITDQFVSSACQGGLLALGSLIAILVWCYSNIGSCVRITRDVSPETEKLFWCLGSALFAHTIALFSVTYFDQMHVPWWGLLAMISGVTSDFLHRATELKTNEEPCDSTPELGVLE